MEVVISHRIILVFPRTCYGRCLENALEGPAASWILFSITSPTTDSIQFNQTAIAPKMSHRRKSSRIDNKRRYLDRINILDSRKALQKSNCLVFLRKIIEFFFIS